MTDNTITLADGRTLGYAVYGNPAGWPVLYLHGTPSSRLEVSQLAAFGIDAAAHLNEKGLCLIAPDRPGMGLSSFHPQGSLRSCAADAATLLRHLKIDQCTVMAWSGGGPYALAFAHDFPQMAREVQIFCGFTRRFDAEVVRHMQGNKWYFLTARNAPALLKWTMRQAVRQSLTQPPPRLLTGLRPVDYRLFGNPVHYPAITRTSIKEACRNGADGPVYEAALYFRDFGFRLSNIRTPVQYWYGSEDRMVIPLHAKAIESELPQGKVRMHPGEGHLSIWVKHFSTALTEISENV